MSDARPEDNARVDATLDEFSRRTKGWIAFRDEVLGRDDEAVVERDEAAAILHLPREKLDAEVDGGLLGVELASGGRIIRASDLRVRYRAELARREAAGRGLAQLRAELDLDE